MADQDTETLLPCPACKGAKSLLHEGSSGHSYRMLPCRWCDRTGCVSYKQLRKFLRWNRILKANAGRCKK